MPRDAQRGHLIDAPWRSCRLFETGLEAVRHGFTNSLETRDGS